VFPLLASLSLGFALGAPAAGEAVAGVPALLASRCGECHGSARRESGLNLGSRESLLAGGDSGPVVRPGDPDGSRLVRLVAGLDPTLRMPLNREPLTPAEVDLVRAWVVAGAPYGASSADAPGPVESRHWAYRAPERPEPPAVSDPAWVRTPIDAFVLARLDAEGLSPSPPAGRETWLRRVHLDLVGLPPTIEEQDAFLGDRAPGAEERAVDRLLASLHYGEERARRWLDLARYADTHGFEKDNRRTMWRWRDWVIDAFNDDMPFDRFAIEQMAGDLLPAPTLEQRVATGFHRNTMTNEEGGVDPEEARHENLLDRVNTTATVFLGSTIACAQCHTHKFDPFTQREYYELLAFFEGDAEPAIEAPTPGILARRSGLEREIAAFEARLGPGDEGFDAALKAFERDGPPRLVRWRTIRPASALSSGGAEAAVREDGSVVLSGPNPPGDTVTVVATASLEGARSVRVEALTDGSLPSRGPGRAANASFVLTEVEMTAAPLDAPGSARAVRFVRARADYEQAENPASSAIDGRPETGWAIDAWRGDAFRVDRALVLDLAEPIAIAGEAAVTVTIRNGSRWPHANVGRFRLSTSEAADAGRDLDMDGRVRAALALAPPDRTDADRAAILSHVRERAPEFEPIRSRLAALRAEVPAIPTALVLGPGEKPRATRVRRGGAFTSPAEAVEPGVPAVFPPLPEGATRDRLLLARWLVSSRNPLFSRVAVNRFWEDLFGRGLVATSEDFGTQGDPPTHPLLLDWLATEFAGGGYSVKSLLRTIVLSSTYRQSSRTKPSLLERDPENRLLARGARRRLDAETIRDTALAASGLLHRAVGGESAFPPQPDGIWTMIYSTDKWVTDEGPGRYRRGLYTFWRRTAPYPSFSIFDAPSREVSCPRRPRTNTPLQALVTLNDPTFVEPALALGRRLLLAAAAEGPEAAAVLGFRLCAARRPEPVETDRLVALFRDERARFAADPSAALRFVAAGPPALRGGDDPADLAAWGVVGNVLLNLDETITRE